MGTGIPPWYRFVVGAPDKNKSRRGAHFKKGAEHHVLRWRQHGDDGFDEAASLVVDAHGPTDDAGVARHVGGTTEKVSVVAD